MNDPQVGASALGRAQANAHIAIPRAAPIVLELLVFPLAIRLWLWSRFAFGQWKCPDSTGLFGILIYQRPTKKKPGPCGPGCSSRRPKSAITFQRGTAGCIGLSPGRNDNPLPTANCNYGQSRVW